MPAAPATAASTAAAPHSIVPVHFVLPYLGESGTRVLVNIVAALLILLIGAWLASRIANLSRRSMQRARIDVTLIGFLRNLFYGVLLAVVIVMALAQAGIPSAPLVAALGTAGLAIGLALQDSLKNLASGVLIIVFRPFGVGDYISGGGAEGTVQAINLMHTLILLPDGREAILPNGKVGSDAVTNFNRTGTRRFEWTVGIGYNDDIGTASTSILAVLADNDKVLADPAPGVWVHNLGESSVDLLVRGWCHTDEFWGVRHAVLRAIKERLDADGISMPFPQREMSVVHSVAPETPLNISRTLPSRADPD